MVRLLEFWILKLERSKSGLAVPNMCANRNDRAEAAAQPAAAFLASGFSVLADNEAMAEGADSAPKNF